MSFKIATIMAELNEDFDGIKVTETNQTNDSWTFLVELGQGEGLIEYWVDIDREYWTRLTNRRVEPEELVLETFKFLLDKKPKELLLRKFNISDVASNFPMFESYIKKSL